ncbi:hypothetical protein [Dactylosporangium matsuzakiense]|uniref:hypothetical protein n=1 Tax=Dactylosporangium matsuzakiense TaxID=53360 RepID=UPI0031EC1A97
MYGGKDGVPPTPLPATDGGSPLENSGSLTGHILSQGAVESDDDDEAPRRNGPRRVMIIISVMVVVLLVGGYFAVTLAHSFIDSVFGNIPGAK